MKWSRPLVTASMGMRTTELHVVPFRDVDMTMSLDVQPERKRQSCQAVYTRPAASTSDDGIASCRMLPATVWTCVALTVTGADQLAPPLVDVKARIALTLAEPIGTTTLPLG